LEDKIGTTNEKIKGVKDGLEGLVAGIYANIHRQADHIQRILGQQNNLEGEIRGLEVWVIDKAWAFVEKMPEGADIGYGES